MVKIDKLMIIRGVSVKQLAREAEISQGYASKIKLGKRMPSLEVGKRIATLLAHPVDGIFFGYDLGA